MQPGAIYRARDDDGGDLQELPAQRCSSCGCLQPDMDRIEEMGFAAVPSGVRLRCAQIRAAEKEPTRRVRRG
jgi:hypothetical protein